MLVMMIFHVITRRFKLSDERYLYSEDHMKDYTLQSLINDLEEIKLKLGAGSEIFVLRDTYKCSIREISLVMNRDENYERDHYVEIRIE